jgi:hypothetical protein
MGPNANSDSGSPGSGQTLPVEAPTQLAFRLLCVTKANCARLRHIFGRQKSFLLTRGRLPSGTFWTGAWAPHAPMWTHARAQPQRGDRCAHGSGTPATAGLYPKRPMARHQVFPAVRCPSGALSGVFWCILRREEVMRSPPLRRTPQALTPSSL